MRRLHACSSLALAIGLVALLAGPAGAQKPTVELTGCRLVAKGVAASTAAGISSTLAGVDVLRKSHKAGFVAIIAKNDEDIASVGDILSYCHRQFTSDKKITAAWKSMNAGP